MCCVCMSERLSPYITCTATYRNNSQAITHNTCARTIWYTGTYTHHTHRRVITPRQQRCPFVRSTTDSRHLLCSPRFAHAPLVRWAAPTSTNLSGPGMLLRLYSCFGDGCRIQSRHPLSVGRRCGAQQQRRIPLLPAHDGFSHSLGAGRGGAMQALQVVARGRHRAEKQRGA